MASVEINLTCNLQTPVKVQYIDGNMFSLDNAGNTINVLVFNGEEPAELGGSVAVSVIRSDGATVAVSGEISGNKASAILPQSCYAVPGVVSVVVKNVQSTTVTTLAAFVANVYQTSTETTVDPGTIIPSVSALIAQIEAAVDSVPADYSALLATIAADYSSSKTYPTVGAYAWCNGVLRRSIVPITTAETYNSAHWTDAVIGDDLSNLKSALSREQEINETEITLVRDDYEIKRRYITAQGSWSTPASSSTLRSAVVRIPDGCTGVEITTDGENVAYYAFLSSDTGFSDGSGLSPQFSAEYPSRIEESAETDTIFNVYEDVKYLFFIAISSTGATITPGVKFFVDAKESIGLLLNNETVNLDHGTISNDSIDSSGSWVSSSGSFQASYVRVPTGTKTIEVTPKSGTIVAFLKNLTNRVAGGAASFADDYSGRIGFSNETTKKFIVGTDCKWLYTNTVTRDGVDVAPVIVFKPDVLRNGDVPDIEEYTNGKFFDILPTLYEGWFNWKLHFSYLSGGSTNSADGFATTEPIPVVPGNQIVNVSAAADDDENPVSFFIVEFDGDTFIRRYSFANGSEYVVPSGVNYIRFMFGFASAYNISITKPMLSKYFAVKFLSVAAQNDFETPVYVAYGASTTIGAVHRFTGQGTYYSAYSFPDYIGRALNLKTYNHGHGTTGFLARADGDAPNFMDAIYADDELLKTASLVTIIFGYGNDRTAGLPIGLYDDYYPYDEEGYHPSGSAGIAEMLSKGATLMGCLNWCIKWISEHYPKINLVILFGSPSGNEDRTVSKIENPDTTSGRPPYKLTFVDPYPDPGTYNPYAIPSSAGGAAQIRIEYPKLKKALNMPFIDLSNEGTPINYYNATAKDEDGKYAIFSTTGTADDQTTWAWNSHPNDAGYKLYAQYIAGRVIALYKH